jgi:glucokinase
MTDQLAIGVDIGGTKIAFALVNRDGHVLATHRLPTLPAEGAEAVFSRVVQGIDYLHSQTAQPIAGVGIGCPGYINPITGVVHNATNLGWRDVSLMTGVQERLHVSLPVWVQKDANAGTLGELYFGAGQGYSDFVYIALGTGLGGGAISGGTLVQGGKFNGMEIGHMPFNPGGRLCACGMHGCPEMYTSGTGILAGVCEHLPAYPQSILAQITDVTPEAVLKAARAGDELALLVLNEAAQWLSSVMITLMGVLNPSAFVIGGGMGHAAAEFLIPTVKKMLHERTDSTIYPEIPIVESQVTSSAVGAACQVWFGLQSSLSPTLEAR